MSVPLCMPQSERAWRWAQDMGTQVTPTPCWWSQGWSRGWNGSEPLTVAMAGFEPMTSLLQKLGLPGWPASRGRPGCCDAPRWASATSEGGGWG